MKVNCVSREKVKMPFYLETSFLQLIRKADKTHDDIRDIMYSCLKATLRDYQVNMSRNMTQSNEPSREKTNNVVSQQVRHKPSCTSTEDR